LFEETTLVTDDLFLFHYINDEGVYQSSLLWTRTNSDSRKIWMKSREDVWKLWGFLLCSFGGLTFLFKCDRSQSTESCNSIKVNVIPCKVDLCDVQLVKCWRIWWAIGLFDTNFTFAVESNFDTQISMWGKDSTRDWYSCPLD